MIKVMTLVLALVAFSAPAFAGSCPAMINQIDAALSAGKAKNASEVKKLRDQGESLHRSGGHAASVQVLQEAMKLAGLTK